jgi:hypothetical protein
LDSTKADVIILGSGRAHAHYVPDIMEKKLGLTCFNTGMDGNYLPNNYAVYRSIINRYTPKIILLDIRNLNELFVGSGGYEQISTLLPYYKDNEEIRSIIALKSKHERIKLISKIYPFNSSLLIIIKGLLGEEDISELKGYRPFHGNLTGVTIPHKEEVNKEKDFEKIEILEAIASECKALNVRLVFIQSPLYTLVEQGEGVTLINEIAGKYDTEFWDYINDTTFLKPEYFRDIEHMNDLGAREFTKEIAARISDLLIGENSIF